MDFDLAQIRAFVVAADHRSMSRAAASLHLSQQALSKRVRRLEDMVGLLFERGAGGVVLTAAGTAFLPAARQLLAAADAALAAARAGPAAPLRVDVWGHLHEPMRLVRRFAQRHPGAVIEVSMRRNLPQALTALQRRELDLALGNVADLAGPLPVGLHAELVAITPLVAMVNRAGPLGRAEAIGAAELGEHGLWLPFRASSPELMAFVLRYAGRLNVPVRTDGANLGVDVLVDHVARDPSTITLYDPGWGTPASDRVRLVPLRPVPRYPWYAIWAGPAVHRSLRALLDFMHAAQPVVVKQDGQVLDSPPSPS